MTEQVADGVQQLTLPNDSGGMPYTLTYLVEDADGGVHVIDAGWDSDRNAAAVREALAGRTLGSIVVTHLHPDHIGLSERLRAEHGAPILLTAVEDAAQKKLTELTLGDEGVLADFARWGVPDERKAGILAGYPRTGWARVEPDGHIADGDLLAIPGRSIRVIDTPGHTPGHICLHDEDHGLLFSGDHILPGVRPGIGLGGRTDRNPIEAYLTSLERIQPFDDCEILPGHEHRFRGVAERAQLIARHHLARTIETEKVLAQHPDASVWDIASRLTWSRGWDGLVRHYIVAAIRQTEMHVELVRSGDDKRLRAVWGC